MAVWLFSIVLSAASLFGQAPASHPSFAGTWAPVEGVSPAVNLVVTQTAAGLTATSGDGHVIECSLDGKTTKQKDENADVTATWNGPSLVLTIVTTSDFGDTNIVKQTWSLDAKGQLILETARERRGQTQVQRAVYRKAG